ncbi:MAG: 3-keto-disaccharide hydrolase [Bacteroidota bacterium]
MKKIFVLIILSVFMSATLLETTASAPAGKGKGNKLTGKEKKQGWELMFDGKTLNGWRGYNRQDVPPVWLVENGTLRVDKSKQVRGDRSSTGDIIFDRKLKNFEFTFEWMIDEAGNSGVFFYGQEIEGKPIYSSAPEFQLLDNEKHPDGAQGKNGNRKSASLYDMIPAVPQNGKPALQWNSGGIKVKDGKVEHYQNGVKVVEYTLWTPEWLNMIENSKFKGWQEMINVGGPNREGYIGLQWHSDNIWFRNLKIREL